MIPALWREHYGGLSGWRFDEFAEVARCELHMLRTNQNDFHNLARQEIRKYRRQNLIDDAATLMAGTEEMGFDQAGKPGIRAQLVERSNNELVMDFLIEGDARSTPSTQCHIPSLDLRYAFCSTPGGTMATDELNTSMPIPCERWATTPCPGLL